MLWPPKTILHPTDFSKCSEHAFDLACGLALLNKGKVIVLHVHAPPVVTAGNIPSVMVDVEGGKNAEKLLHMIQPKRPDVVIEHLMIMGTATESILNAAKSSKADLIVMGTHGHTGLTRMLLGSVAEHVVRRSTCPVLTARPQEEERTIEIQRASAHIKPEHALAIGVP